MSHRIHSWLVSHNLELAANISTSEIRHLLIGRKLMEEGA